MPELADKGMMDAFNAQQGVVTKGIQVRFFRGAEPDTLATKGCRKDCDTQHPHLDTCILEGCPPNCNTVHTHGKDCPADCRQGHHIYICQNKHHIKAAGRPRFREIVYLKKVIPGDVLNVIVRPARLPEDEQEFPQAWQDYLNGVEHSPGTSLDMLPFLSEAQKAEFRAANCFTAEAIRDMPDVVAQKFMGIHDIRRKVANFLSASTGEADKKIAYLEKKLDELTRAMKK